MEGKLLYILVFVLSFVAFLLIFFLTYYYDFFGLNKQNLPLILWAIFIVVFIIFGIAVVSLVLKSLKK